MLLAQTALSLQKVPKRTLYRQNKVCGSIPSDLSKKPIQLIADSAFLGLSKTACLAGGSKEAFAMSNHRQLRLTCVMGADAGGDLSIGGMQQYDNPSVTAYAAQLLKVISIFPSGIFLCRYRAV